MDGRKLDQDPMQMPSWSIGMACVWIVNRTPEGAARLWSNDLIDAWINDDDTANEPIQDARTELTNALALGDVDATGLLPNGQRIPIPSLEWEDMKFSYALRDDAGLVHRAENAAGSLYTDIRVGREGIIARWPAQAARSATILDYPGGRRRGPKPKVLEAVVSAMRAYDDKKELASMTEEAMASQFKASRDTCRKARNAVLSELPVNSDN